jgi:hypothetical protein
MVVEGFILVAYALGTAIGWYMGRSSGIKRGIEDCIDNLLEKGYLKFKGHKNNPEILKHDETY